MSLYQAAVVAGVAVGGIYALIAVGITQIFKVTGVLNFAHAGFVLVAAHVYGYLTYNDHWHVAPAVAITLAVSLAMGVVAYLTVFRFADQATLAAKVIVTLGLFQVIYAAAIWIFPPGQQFSLPVVPIASVSIFGTDVGISQLVDLGGALCFVVAVGFFLRYTRLGLLTRATAEDGAMAELFGARRAVIGTVNWAIAAFAAGLAGILIATMGGFTNDFFLTYFIFSLPATLLGGLRSLPLTALGGVLLGVIITVIGASGNSYATSFVFAGLVLVVLAKRHWPADLGRIGWTRPSLSIDPKWSTYAGSLGIGAVCAVGLVVLALTNTVWAETVALVVIFAIAAASLVPILGWTGQISLAQGAMMGIGACSSASFANHYGWPLPLALVVGALVAGVFGGLLGIVVGRLSFVLTAVVTLAFAPVAPLFMIGRFAPWVHSSVGNVAVATPSYLDTPLRQAGCFALVGALVAWLLVNTRRSVWGTRFFAAKTSPTMAAHFGVGVLRARIFAYAFGGALAGLAGGLYVILLGYASAGFFSNTVSLNLLLYAVAGGVLRVWGPLVGAVLFIAAPQLFDLNRFGISPWPTLAVGLVIILVSARSPDGLCAYVEMPTSHAPRVRLAAAVLTSAHRVLERVAPNAARTEVLSELARSESGGLS